MTWRRSSVSGSLAFAAAALAVAACGGEKHASAPAAAATKIAITPTSDARADAATYLKQLCPKPIGGELNFMVWEGYTDTLFTKPFEEACGVKVNATYMGSSDDLVAKLRAGGAETIDLISPSSDAATAIVDAGLAISTLTERRASARASTGRRRSSPRASRHAASPGGPQRRSTSPGSSAANAPTVRRPRAESDQRSSSSMGTSASGAGAR